MLALKKLSQFRKCPLRRFRLTPTHEISMATSQQVLDAISTDHLHADLKGRSVRGGFWTLGSQGAQFLLQTISTVVLRDY